MTRMFLTLALAFFVGISTTYAEDGPKKKDGPKKTAEEIFKAKDKDGDGIISLAEFQGKAKREGSEARFKAKDKDNNGEVTLEEFTAKKERVKKPKKDKSKKE